MNLVVGAPVWLVAMLVLVLAAAAIEDVIRLRISNLASIAVLILAIIAMGFHGFPASLWQNVLVFAAVLVAGTFAFARGWFGGGDVKLLAAVGLWMSLRGALILLGMVFIAGGLIGLVYIAKGALKGVSRAERKKARNVAYGLAIAAGALVSVAAQRRPADPNPYITSLQRATAGSPLK